MLFSKNEKEFRTAYSNFYPVIYNVLYTKLGRKEDAEDICHEVFVSFYKKFDEIKDHRKWLYGSLRFTISNYYRNKEVPDSEKINIDKVPGDKNLSFENGARDIRIIINEAIENMDNFRNEKEKILFELIAINNFTYKQAGKQLGLSVRQVGYIYRQTSKKILGYLKKKGINKIEDLL